eukprot:m.39669 g.39669  ORF g.39669 m.39669 type:complete len:116 (-) comp10301_c0_seq1:741-1088(-)
MVLKVALDRVIISFYCSCYTVQKNFCAFYTHTHTICSIHKCTRMQSLSYHCVGLLRTSLMEKFSVIKSLDVKITTTFTSNCILKLLVERDGHVNSRGKDMKIGICTPRQTFPSAI